MDFTEHTPLRYSNKVTVYFRNEQKLPLIGVDLMLSVLIPYTWTQRNSGKYWICPLP